MITKTITLTFGVVHIIASALAAYISFRIFIAGEYIASVGILFAAMIYLWVAIGAFKYAKTL